MTIGTYPGVYIQEVSSGVRPIAAASTSTAAFVGVAERGPVGIAKKVFNFTEYQNHFGGFLNGFYLSHAVFQFFNNGGSQCYIVRVAGAGVAVAKLDLNDQGATAQKSLAIEASSPGAWGNSLAILINKGTNDEVNEFNLSVFRENDPIPLETLANLSVVPSDPNFVDKATSSSNYIRVTYNQDNTNAGKGTSRGSDGPAVPLTAPATKFRININGDGYQEIDLQDAIGPVADADHVTDLTTAENVATAIQILVRKLSPQHATSPETKKAFEDFTATKESSGELLLTSGVAGSASSVHVAPAGSLADDASGSLKLGRLHGGIETRGVAVTRPIINAPGSLPVHLTEGSNGSDINSDLPYINAFSILDAVEDVSLLCVPGIGSPDLMGAAMNYCENRSLSDCFFIGDMTPDDDSIEEAKLFRDLITPKNSYGAVYLPWLKMLDPTGQSVEPILAPPSGYVAGMYAKTDAQRGVWKAPAGTAAALAGAVGLAVNFNDVQQGNLNPINVNVIRQFAASGIVLWGARTITSDPEWLYIPVRRLAIMLRVSIYNGIQWAVFEPNDEPLWSQLRLNIGAFMMTLFRQGAFQGSTPSQAFFVKCDSQTTTQADIDLGIVNILVGFAPLKPAEFIVVKISQKAGQASA